MEPFEDENVPLFTVGQVAEMLSLKQAFLRRVDQLQVVSPQRSNGGQRRYTRIEIRIIQQVASMADEGMTMPAIRRIIELEQQLARSPGSATSWRRGFQRRRRNGSGWLSSSNSCSPGPAATGLTTRISGRGSDRPAGAGRSRASRRRGLP